MHLERGAGGKPSNKVLWGCSFPGRGGPATGQPFKASVWGDGRVLECFVCFSSFTVHASHLGIFKVLFLIQGQGGSEVHHFSPAPA